MVQAVIGELATVKGDVHLQWPEPRVKDDAGNVITTVRSDVPDLIHVSGRWNESSTTQKNAPLHYRFRRGQPFPGALALEWTINGEKGEIRITSRSTTFLQVGQPTDPAVIEVHDFETDKVEKLAWDWEEWQQDLPFPARSIGTLYEEFAEVKGSGAKERYVTFDVATRRHEQLESVLANWRA